MSELGDIEQTIVDALAAAPDPQAPMLATVRAHVASDRREMLARLQRERTPAAYVSVGARAAGANDHARLGAPIVNLWLYGQSRRGQADARTASQEAGGLHAVVHTLTVGLHRLPIVGERRLVLVRDESIAGDEHGLLWLQTYEVRSAAVSPPLFGGAALCGPYSDVRVDVGPIELAEDVFSFPGIDGVFRRVAGRRGRRIVWRGTLRDASDASLHEIESVIEAAVAAGTADVVIDPWGRAYADCVPVRYAPSGAREPEPATGLMQQDFELEFLQASVW